MYSPCSRCSSASWTGGSVSDPPARCDEIPLQAAEYEVAVLHVGVGFFGPLGRPGGVAVNADAAADVGDDGDGGGPVTMCAL